MFAKKYWYCADCRHAAKVSFWDDGTFAAFCPDCTSVREKITAEDFMFGRREPKEESGIFSETVEDMRRESRQLDADIKEAKEIRSLEQEIARKKETLEKCYEGEEMDEPSKTETESKGKPFGDRIPLDISWDIDRVQYRMYFKSRAGIRRFLEDLNRFSKERYTYYYPDE